MANIVFAPSFLASLRIALHIADQNAVQLVTVGEVDRFLALEVAHERFVLRAKVCGRRNLDAVCQFISDGGGVESETKQDRRLSLFVQLFNFVELVEIEIVGRGDSEEAALGGIQEGMKQGIQQGMKQGMQQGRCLEVYSLVQDGILDPEVGASRVSMSLDDFADAMQKAGYKLPEMV